MWYSASPKIHLQAILLIKLQEIYDWEKIKFNHLNLNSSFCQSLIFVLVYVYV